MAGEIQAERVALAIEPHAPAPLRQHLRCAPTGTARSGVVSIRPNMSFWPTARARDRLIRELHRRGQRMHQRRAIRARAQSAAPERISASSTRRLMRSHRCAGTGRAGRETARSLALRDQRLDGRLPDALDRAQAVADAALTRHREHVAASVDVRRLDREAHAARTRRCSVTTLSVLSMSEDSTAAMNSAG